MAATPEQRSRRGVDDRAELVVEIRSPHDEVPEKLPWYAQRVREILVVDQDPVGVNLYRSEDGKPVQVEPFSEVLGVRLLVEDGRLSIDHDGHRSPVED